jgi:hypothetical protein
VKSKTKSVKHAKKNAWDAFSVYIRTRDCLASTGTTESGRCCTCGKIYPFKSLQAGHWTQGRHNSVLFDERNCHAQCYHCNIGLRGNPIAYFHFMERKYGRAVMDEVEALDQQTRQFKAFELTEIKERFQEKTKECITEFHRQSQPAEVEL